MNNISYPGLCLFSYALPFSRSRKSILTDVVSDVNAPSALGKAAEISPIRNTTPANGPRYLIAIVGKISSLEAIVKPFILNKYQKQCAQEQE